MHHEKILLTQKRKSKVASQQLKPIFWFRTRTETKSKICRKFWADTETYQKVDCQIKYWDFFIKILVLESDKVTKGTKLKGRIYSKKFYSGNFVYPTHAIITYFVLTLWSSSVYCDHWPYVLWPLDFQIQKRIVSAETIWGNTVA